jgi:hypothetical protein
MGKWGHSSLYEPPGRGIAILVGSEGFNATNSNPLHLQWLFSGETIHAAQGFAAMELLLQGHVAV